MSIVATLTEVEVKQFVIDWYRKLDVHAPVDELLPRLAAEGLEVRLPETTLYSHADFINWYEGVTRKFFNEVHTMKELHVTIASGQADVQLVVNWQAFIWNAPAPKSQWLGFDAAQSWVVKPSEEDGRLLVVTYIVDALTPMPGSPDL
jgi:hypothetical protein